MSDNQISKAVAVLIAEARLAFPDVEPSLLRFSLTPDGCELQILAPGLRWHVVPLAKE